MSLSNIRPLKTLTVDPLSQHTATVIFIHGLGDSGHGWKPIVDIFQADPSLHHVKWILPHSPSLRVTANMFMEMPSWFDIKSFGFDCEEDEKGMLQAVHSINQLVSAEVDAGIDSEHIIVAGFSQGGAMCLLVGLSSERKLAGIAVLSGWLPLRHKIKAMSTRHAASLPIFWGHGTNDPLVKYQFGEESAHFLTKELRVPLAASLVTPDAAGLKGLAFNSYNGVGHSADPKELVDLRNWLKKVIPPDRK